MRWNDGKRGSLYLQPVCARLGRTMAGLALLFTCSLGFAQSDFVRLVPPDAPVLAGMRRTPEGRGNEVLWLATKNNSGDLNQLLALTAKKRERHANEGIEEVIVADSASKTDSLGNHLLLARGEFNFASMSAVAMAGGAKGTTYDGVPVVVLDGSAGEGAGVRWLAVLRGDIALIGSPAAVKQALDRYRSGAAADDGVVARLKRIPERDAAWSSVVLDSRAVASHLDVRGYTGGMLPCLRHARELDLGIRLGPEVTIDLTAESNSGADAGSAEPAGVAAGCLRAALFSDGTQLTRVALPSDRRPEMRITLSRGEYDGWLDGFRKKMTDGMLEAMVSAPEDSDASAGTAKSPSQTPLMP